MSDNSRKWLAISLLLLFIFLKIYLDFNPGKWGMIGIAVGAFLLIFDEPAKAQ